MKINAEQIKYTAQLARLSLTETEISEFSEQLSSIIDYTEKINELDTASEALAEYITELKNIFREDSARSCSILDDIERLAPDFRDGYIVVPKIIE